MVPSSAGLAAVVVQVGPGAPKMIKPMAEQRVRLAVPALREVRMEPLEPTEPKATPRTPVMMAKTVRMGPGEWGRRI
jgi:hypothetical protein